MQKPCRFKQAEPAFLPGAPGPVPALRSPAEPLFVRTVHVGYDMEKLFYAPKSPILYDAFSATFPATCAGMKNFSLFSPKHS